MFNRANARDIIDEINAAVQKVAAKHGVNIKPGNSTFSPENLNVKLIVSQIDETGEAVTPEVEALRAYSPDMEGKTFKYNGGEYTVVGFRPKAHKRPYIATNEYGKRYAFPREALVRGMRA